jgi:hypothetical protein
MMIEEHLARLRAHRNNIHRYRRLLATNLSEVEQAYIEKRLREEEAAADKLLSSSFALRFPPTSGTEALA